MFLLKVTIYYIWKVCAFFQSSLCFVLCALCLGSKRPLCLSALDSVTNTRYDFFFWSCLLPFKFWCSFTSFSCHHVMLLHASVCSILVHLSCHELDYYPYWILLMDVVPVSDCYNIFLSLFWQPYVCCNAFTHEPNLLCL